jgi:hypothetical protein
MPRPAIAMSNDDQLSMPSTGPRTSRHHFPGWSADLLVANFDASEDSPVTVGSDDESLPLAPAAPGAGHRLSAAAGLVTRRAEDLDLVIGGAELAVQLGELVGVLGGAALGRGGKLGAEPSDGLDVLGCGPLLGVAPGSSLPPCSVAAGLGSGSRVVLDGELVLWREGRLDFAALQQRVHPADARARQLSLASPASFVVFDVLALDHRDVRPLPYRARRALLEDLLGRQLPHGLVLMPATTDPAVARAWLTNHSAAGIEGVVAKRRDQP